MVFFTDCCMVDEGKNLFDTFYVININIYYLIILRDFVLENRLN